MVVNNMVEYIINDRNCRGFLNFYLYTDIEESYPEIEIERLNDFANYISLKFNQAKFDEDTGIS